MIADCDQLHQFWDPMLMQEPLAPTGDEITVSSRSWVEC